MEKLVCPFHTRPDGSPEREPSLALYEERYYCFSCRASGPLSDLGPGYTGGKAKAAENLSTSLYRIANLPTQRVRGFDLPADDLYYYLVWPNKRYYIKRRHEDHPKYPKYVAPSGHSRPTYIPKRGDTGVLWYVEGEFNALSLAQVVPDTVASPGGAAAFAKKNWPLFKRYATVIVVADDDSAGADAAYLLADRLTNDMGKKAIVQLWQQDANSVFVEKGKDELRQEVARRLQEAE